MAKGNNTGEDIASELRLQQLGRSGVFSPNMPLSSSDWLSPYRFSSSVLRSQIALVLIPLPLVSPNHLAKLSQDNEMRMDMQYLYDKRKAGQYQSTLFVLPNNESLLLVDDIQHHRWS